MLFCYYISFYNDFLCLTKLINYIIIIDVVIQIRAELMSIIQIQIVKKSVFN